MRLRKLHLRAFGPFTARVLDFGAGAQNLVVVWGANEAGKSSALRAISALRFGIPMQSKDDFVHPHPSMRVGGEFVDRDGRLYSLVRRKGRSATLRVVDFANPGSALDAVAAPEIEALLKQAEDVDAAEDAQYGKGKRGDELPEELARRESRLKKIAQAKAELEQEAREKAERERAEAEAKLTERREQQERTGNKIRGREPRVPDPEQAQPEAKAQRNFTDPASRIMPDGANKGSFLQGYNAQAAVDAKAQVIVAAEVTQETTDNRQLLPMLCRVEQNMGRKPEAVSADAGYWSEANATDESVAGIDLHIATGREKHKETIGTASEPPPLLATAKEAMRHKLRTEAGRSIYKMRKAIVEPVFGQIKERRGFRRVSLRGLENVRHEWKLVCLTSNLLKLFGAGWLPKAA